ncbi:DEAD/DEAH box helicase [bacterium]|nr:DEAD/DEAH box helicase [bacterium]MCI0605838.1 DEAD/DEAH box helicase [bacterium]
MSALELFHPNIQKWFRSVFSAPTKAQESGWPLIEKGEHTLMIAPTGSGKTLAAFLCAIHHIMFSPLPEKNKRCRVLYISPLKALAVDVERNLRLPIAGITSAAENDTSLVIPLVAIRTGDTSSKERAHFLRNPSDILITTPESLYLLLTSNARENLRSIRWVIVDEIHAMVGTKRGAHLAVSLERLNQLTEQPFQRIGLSATVRPLQEAANFLGGYESDHPRPVSIVNAGSTKQLDLQVIAPLEDMSRLGEVITGPSRFSIWPALHAQILHLIRTHRTTLIFVNNRRLAERLAAALNELAETDLVRAHHGSVSHDQRLQIEEDLKTGNLPAIVATSSLELGIDMGAIDLVLQVESPPGVASALQRIGRAGHQLDVPSKGIVFPKYRGDLVACAALTDHMLEGKVEETHYLRNPLDVLAQQIVAMVSMDSWKLDDLEKVLNGAAPFQKITRGMLENVLDMLSGRYPSDEFAELRPRIVWDRISGKLQAREGARRTAIVNGGTIPDRGLFHVFLIGAEPGKGRVGELDEEMVFETRIGETFLLGTTSWRVEEITHDRVLVSPAPGIPAKMPFWKGEGAGRPVEFGRAIGSLMRKLQEMNPKDAEQLLMQEHKLDDWAAKNLLAYLQEQKEKTETIPDDQTIVIERYVDDLGDWRICILSTFGARVHAPWTHAIEAMIRDKWELHVETLWSDDGIVIRLPETDEPPPIEFFLPDPEEAEHLVMNHLSSSALFSSRFREAAARALLLPRRYPGQRTPLWQQRKRAFDLLQITSKFPSFPILLETYREVLQDVFDMPGFLELLRGIRSRSIRVVTINTTSPSPFASSLMFGYIGNFIYEGDAPLAERRAQALAIDPVQLRELLGESELRELLDPDVIEKMEMQLQHLDAPYLIRSKDALHDLLLRIGDLTTGEIKARSSEASKQSSAGVPPAGCADGTSALHTVENWLNELSRERRILQVNLAEESRWIAAEDAGRYRDGLGIPIPAEVPAAFRAVVADPLGDLVSRYARTHAPFSAEEMAGRMGMDVSNAQEALTRLEKEERILQGDFTRAVQHREWCDATVFRRIRQKSLAKLRREVEPVEPAVYGRFLPQWHGVDLPRAGTDAWLEVIEQLQGYPIPASVLETQILPSRFPEYEPAELDRLMSSGLVLWSGVEALGKTDGRIALYLAENAAQLLRPPETKIQMGELHLKIKEFLSSAGASFFPQIHGVTGGFKQEVLAALWELVWAGEVTNDTLMPLRALLRSKKRARRTHILGIPSRSGVPLEGTGRWSLLSKLLGSATPTQRVSGTAQQLLNRLGVVTREAIAAEKMAGGFSAVYPVLKAMEEAGRVRRGYFIAGRGAAQFALPGALDRLRSLREISDESSNVILAATDPANPYGASLPWPQRPDSFVPGRIAGARVVLVNGELAAYLSRGQRTLYTFLKSEDPEHQIVIDGIVSALAGLVESGKRRALYLTEIDGKSPGDSPLAAALQREGFTAYAGGWQKK